MSEKSFEDLLRNWKGEEFVEALHKIDGRQQPDFLFLVEKEKAHIFFRLSTTMKRLKATIAGLMVLLTGTATFLISNWGKILQSWSIWFPAGP